MSKTLDSYLQNLHRTKSQEAFIVPHEHILAIKAEQDARIAELTAIAEGAYEGSLNANCKVDELTARNAELEAEVAMCRKALADVAKESWNIESDQGDRIREVIRKALKGDA